MLPTHNHQPNITNKWKEKTKQGYTTLRIWQEGETKNDGRESEEARPPIRRYSALVRPPVNHVGAAVCTFTFLPLTSHADLLRRRELSCMLAICVDPHFQDPKGTEKTKLKIMEIFQVMGKLLTMFFLDIGQR